MISFAQQYAKPDRDFLKKIDGLIEEVGDCTFSCINAYEDLKASLVGLKRQRDEARREADESAASASQWMQTAQRRADDLATLRADLDHSRKMTHMMATAADNHKAEAVSLRADLEKAKAELKAARMALSEACGWAENRLAIEGHPAPASMVTIVKWREKL